MDNNLNIAIIGAGNLGLSLVKGFINKKNGKNIWATKRNLKQISFLKEQGVNITSDNIEAIKNCPVVLFALKPYKILNILDEVKEHLTPNHTIISLATGIGLDEIITHSGKCTQVFRAMPNVASSVNESITCISYGNVTPESIKKVESVFGMIGQTSFINEELMESATVLGACGTAFALRFIRAMVQAGIQIGFSSSTATKIANQTVKGAAEILLQNGTHPEAEIDKVTTPKGITITGLNEMEHQGFSAALIRGMIKAYDKIDGK